jgi:hypothetical protein
MKQSVLGVSTAALAQFCGIHRNRLSSYLAGTRQLQNHEIIHLDDVYKDLSNLVAAADPWPINWSDVERIKELITRMKSGEFEQRRQS